MTLSVELTLSEARTDVLNRLGMGAQTSTNSTAHPLIDSFINSAQRQLYFEADWVSLRKYLTIDLIEDQADYDWPDDVEPGQITATIAINDDNKESVLVAGIRSADRHRTRNETEGREPRLYEYHDGIIELMPFPSAEWVSLRVEYVASLTPLVSNEDRLSFDSEAILQLAVILAKSHFGHSVTEIDRAERLFREYTKRIRAQQSSKSGFQFGGSQSRYVTRGSQRDRMSRRHRTRRGPYFHGESPW